MPSMTMVSPPIVISSCSNSENSTGLHFQSPPSYSSKPLPHERIMQRSRTVAEGMGTAKLSKKAMLLKWCQFITQDYEVSEKKRSVDRNRIILACAVNYAICSVIFQIPSESIQHACMLATATQ